MGKACKGDLLCRRDYIVDVMEGEKGRGGENTKEKVRGIKYYVRERRESREEKSSNASFIFFTSWSTSQKIGNEENKEENKGTRKKKRLEKVMEAKGRQEKDGEARK